MNCFLDCAAKAIGVDTDELEAKLNYSGREVINDCVPPFCYRGYHPYTVNNLLLTYGYGLIHIPAEYAEHPGVQTKVDIPTIVKDKTAILIDDTHAVLIKDNELYNSSSKITITPSTAKHAFLLVKI